MAPNCPRAFAAKGCASIPFIISLSGREKGVDIPIFYDPYIVLRVIDSDLRNTVRLRASILLEDGQTKHENWGHVPCNLMFQATVRINAERYVRMNQTVPRSFLCNDDETLGFEALFNPCQRDGEELRTIQGVVIMDRPLPFAPTMQGWNFLSQKALQLADLNIVTNDGHVLAHKLLMGADSAEGWKLVFGEGVPELQKDEDGRCVVTALREFSTAAVELYRKLKYTGEVSVSLGELDWANPTVRGLADIVVKMGEEGFLKLLSSVHTISSADALTGFLEWYAPGKGDFAELHLMARLRAKDDEKRKIEQEAKEIRKEIRIFQRSKRQRHDPSSD